MNSIAVLLCVQVCLIQYAFSQCCGNAYSYGIGAPFAAPYTYGGRAAYGGEGFGNVAVAGQLPVGGTTLVAGQVPIIGAVDFGGVVPAAGEVDIGGSCAGGCGCSGAASFAGVPSGAWAGAPYGGIATSAFSGGSLPVTSASPIAPSGVSVQSDNAYCGELAVCGAVPFLGTVGLQGSTPSAGCAAVRYGCGNGEVAMVTEDIGAYRGYGAPLGYATGNAGCGCGRAYY